MKDYTLSMIVAHCRKMKESEKPCSLCKVQNNDIHELCSNEFDSMPAVWDKIYGDIEPHDVIELPCKEHFVYKHDDGHVTENWRVFYRAEFALIGTAVFPTEPEADAFLAKKKTEKEKDDLLFAELKEAEVKFYDVYNRLANQQRTKGMLMASDVDELLEAYERLCEIEKKRGMRK